MENAKAVRNHRKIRPSSCGTGWPTLLFIARRPQLVNIDIDSARGGARLQGPDSLQPRAGSGPNPILPVPTTRGERYLSVRIPPPVDRLGPPFLVPRRPNFRGHGNWDTDVVSVTCSAILRVSWSRCAGAQRGLHSPEHPPFNRRRRRLDDIVEACDQTTGGCVASTRCRHSGSRRMGAGEDINVSFVTCSISRPLVRLSLHLHPASSAIPGVTL